MTIRIPIVLHTLLLSISIIKYNHAQSIYTITDQIDGLFTFDIDSSLWRSQDPQRAQLLMRMSMKDKDKADAISVLQSFAHHDSPFASLPSINILQAVVPNGISDIDAVLRQYDNSGLSIEGFNDLMVYEDMFEDVESLKPLINNELKSIFEIVTLENKMLGDVIIEQHTILRKYRMVIIQLSYLPSDIPEECRNDFYHALSKLR